MPDAMMTYNALRNNLAERLRRANPPVSAGEVEFWTRIKIYVIIFDILALLTAPFLFIYLRQQIHHHVTVWDVSPYCNDSNFNKTLVTKEDDTMVNVTIHCAIVVLIVTLAYCKQRSTSVGHIEILTAVCKTGWIVAMGALALAICIQFLQISFSTPRPYFFSNEELRQYYCAGPPLTMPMNGSLYRTNQTLRTSFPSLEMAFEVYLGALYVFFFDHYDVLPGPHSLQFTLGLTLGIKCVCHGIDAYTSHENHVSDLWVGALLGLVFAVLTIRNLFGNIWRSTTVRNIHDQASQQQDEQVYCHRLRRTINRELYHRCPRRRLTPHTIEEESQF